MNSPLPSPALPSILPRHGKKPPALNTRRALCYIIILFVLTSATFLVQFLYHISIRASTAIGQVYQHTNGLLYEIVEDSQLPDYASPLAVTDSHGVSKWTIHIPSNRGFPLSHEEYSDICSHIDEVAYHVAKSRGDEKDVEGRAYYDVDPNYIDVAEAQLSDLIPFDASFKPGNAIPVCKSSMTYVLDASDAGLGQSLLGLWLTYGLAQREDRAFFIDDSQFAYGKYSDLFTSPPTPKCQPAPPTHRVPCPRMSQHLVVSSATFHWTFGSSFREKFSEEQIFEMMRIGYEALFRLLPSDQLQVAQRITELRALIGQDAVLGGLHIRRGDKHPDEFQYQLGYIPPVEYSTALKELIDEVSSGASAEDVKTAPAQGHTFIVGSDDPDVYKDKVLTLDGAATILRAQEGVSLASKQQPNDPFKAGWERGFFKDTFWNLGLPDIVRRHKHNLHNSPLPTWDAKYKQRVLGPKRGGKDQHETERDYRSEPTSEARRLRSHVARAYLLDLAVLAQSDRLVCAVSSRGCRILGVMMGKDKVSAGHWKNIDLGRSFGWRSEL